MGFWSPEYFVVLRKKQVRCAYDWKNQKDKQKTP